MTLTATEFRKELFALLDRALQGETVEVTYKGAKVTLVPSQPSSKFARLKRQHALLCDPDSIVESDLTEVADMEKERLKNWDEL